MSLATIDWFRGLRENMAAGKNAIAELRDEYRQDDELALLAVSFFVGPVVNLMLSLKYTIQDMQRGKPL